MMTRRVELMKKYDIKTVDDLRNLEKRLFRDFGDVLLIAYRDQDSQAWESFDDWQVAITWLNEIDLRNRIEKAEKVEEVERHIRIW